MKTFVIEIHESELWLCSVDEKQNGEKLAKFVRPELVAEFWTIFALAKRAAHAHGVSGI